ncbi:MAG: cobalt ECF transporter T component CbiQ [Anaerolineae bacterium]|nr:cobalt ECF transporter T component CbiQ [Anaerolineae bacterium]
MFDHILDPYRPGHSLIHRLDPRLKLLAVLAFVIMTISMPPYAWLSLASLAGLILIAGWASCIPLLGILKRSAVVLPFAGLVAISLPFTQTGQVVWSGHLWGWELAITAEGLSSFILLMIRAWLSVLSSGLMIATTPFSDLLDAMRALHVPDVLITIISFMYRYLFVLVDEAQRLQVARQARSVGTGQTVWWRAKVLGGMIGSLFIRSYERSERIYNAMLSRGGGIAFDSATRLVRQTRLGWQAADTWASLGWCTALLVIGLLGWRNL